MSRPQLMLDSNARRAHHGRTSIAFLLAVVGMVGVGYVQWSLGARKASENTENTVRPIQSIMSAMQETVSSQTKNVKENQVKALELLGNAVKQQTAQQKLIQAIQKELETPVPPPIENITPSE